MNSKLSSANAGDLDPARLPVHVAIIMDGNGRWAQKRLLNRIMGHEKGVEAVRTVVRTVVRTCREIGIAYLTLYAFSTENWQRPANEVAALMTLLKKFLIEEQAEMMDRDIRLNAIGQLERLPQDVRQNLYQAMERTKANKAMCLNLALSYGARAEIVKMVKEIAQKVQAGTLETEAITADLVQAHLYTHDIPDPDLLIRTSGEIRISNFLLWQIAYTEIYITDTLWPDFGKDEFMQILLDYQRRERRFGKVEP